MNESPLVSVVVPAYNAARFLSEAVHSALNQTLTNIEVIIVNDGSTDETGAIANELASSDPRVTVLHQTNAGPAVARNRAVHASTGAFVAPLDADDFWHPSKLEHQVSALRVGGATVGLAYCWSGAVNASSQPLHSYTTSTTTANVLPEMVLHNFIGSPSAVLIRRTTFDLVGGFPESFRSRGADGAEDQWFYAQIARHFDFAVVREVHSAYRRRRTAGLSNNLLDMRRGHDLFLDDIRRVEPDLPAALFHWSNLLHSLWVARRAAESRNPRLMAFASKLMLRDAFAQNPLLLTRRPTRLCITSALSARRAKSGSRVEPDSRLSERDVWFDSPRATRESRHRVDQMQRVLSAILAE